MRQIWIGLLLSLGLAASGAANAQSIELIGPEGVTLQVTSADLAGLARDTVALNQHGKTAAYEGVRLGEIVGLAGGATGAAIHGREMATAVRVSGADGYQVILGLAETDPATRRDRVILADRASGEPLGSEGPFRLVVEGDLRPARSARNVVRIEVLRLATPLQASQAASR